jgi:hypothetical protein
MIKKTPREQLLERVNKIITTPVEDLIKNSKVNPAKGTVVYVEIKPKIEELKIFLNEITINRLNHLPDSRFNILNSKLKPILDILDKIHSTERNPSQ